jgi:hypothetical protein
MNSPYAALWLAWACSKITFGLLMIPATNTLRIFLHACLIDGDGGDHFV